MDYNRCNCGRDCQDDDRISMNKPNGYLTGIDTECLTKWSFGKIFAVDLGTYCGLSAFIISQQAQYVLTVDLFEDYEQIEDVISLKHYTRLYEQTKHSFEKVRTQLLSLRKNIFVYKGKTYSTANLFNNGTVDFVFIDADHMYSGVKKDFNSWFPKVKIDGVILFHDTIMRKKWQVGDFIDNEIINRNDLEKIDSMGSIQVFKRVK